MKRDMDLLRRILLQVETGEEMEAKDRPTVDVECYHYELAIEAGLLIGEVHRRASGDYLGARPRRLTWEGHDFLDAARDESIWNRAKKKVIETGGSWTFEALKLVLFEIAKRNLQE